MVVLFGKCHDGCKGVTIVSASPPQASRNRRRGELTLQCRVAAASAAGECGLRLPRTKCLARCCLTDCTLVGDRPNVSGDFVKLPATAPRQLGTHEMLRSCTLFRTALHRVNTSPAARGFPDSSRASRIQLLPRASAIDDTPADEILFERRLQRAVVSGRLGERAGRQLAAAALEFTEAGVAEEHTCDRLGPRVVDVVAVEAEGRQSTKRCEWVVPADAHSAAGQSLRT